MSFLKHLMPTWKTSTDDKTKTNTAILSVLDTELNDSENDAVSTNVLMSLDTSTGEWLDTYGNLFGVLRQDNETDDSYRSRIKGYITLSRGTIPAIKSAIQNFLNDYSSYINIYEPFNNVFFLNSSHLNGADSFLGEYYTTAVIDCQFTNTFPITIADTINKFKAAGVSVKMTRFPNRYKPSATIYQLVTTEDPVQKAMEVQAARDSVYLQLSNSGIIGYKRVYKMILARPLKTGETATSAPYPVITYGNTPYCLVPTDSAVTEGANYVYVSAKLEGEDFPNIGYSSVSLYQNSTIIGNPQSTIVPSLMSNPGTLLLTESRDMQNRVDSLTVEEEFLIQVHQ